MTSDSELGASKAGDRVTKGGWPGHTSEARAAPVLGAARTSCWGHPSRAAALPVDVFSRGQSSRQPWSSPSSPARVQSHFTHPTQGSETRQGTDPA